MLEFGRDKQTEKNQTQHLGKIMVITTKDQLKATCKSIATLDAIIMQDWELRYYSYNAKWSSRHEMASMRNGSGEHYYILFTPNGCVGKGFCKEIAITKETAYDDLPKIFEQPFLMEPAFMTSDVSITFWRLNNDTEWTVRPRGAFDQSCANLLFGIAAGGPETYRKWAENYYECDIPISPVQAIFDHIPLNAKLLSELNPNADQAKLAADIEEIGYTYSLD